jgi:hypothetical protein
VEPRLGRKQKERNGGNDDGGKREKTRGEEPVGEDVKMEFEMEGPKILPTTRKTGQRAGRGTESLDDPENTWATHGPVGNNRAKKRRGGGPSSKERHAVKQHPCSPQKRRASWI